MGRVRYLDIMSSSLKSRIAKLESLAPKLYRLINFTGTVDEALEGKNIGDNEVVIMIKSPLPDMADSDRLEAA